jgi:hypothetical protein
LKSGNEPPTAGGETAQSGTVIAIKLKNTTRRQTAIFFILITSMERIERMQAPLIYSELPSQKQQKDH